MRLSLALLFFLQITLSVAPLLPISDVGAAGEGAAGAGAAGRGASGEGETGTGEGGNTSGGDDATTGCTGSSCHGGSSIPGEPASSSDTGSSEQNAHKAEDIIDNINSVLDAIQSIVSLAVSTSDSSTYTYTITSRAPLPTAAHPCRSAQSIYSACDQTPYFTDQSVSQQASCLCYRQFGGNGTETGTMTTSWAPGFFDGFVSQCDGFVATQTVVAVSASVTGAGASAGATGICASVGDVRASATMTPTTGPSTAAAVTANMVASGGVGRGMGPGMGPVYSGMLFVMGIGMAWSGV